MYGRIAGRRLVASCSQMHYSVLPVTGCKPLVISRNSLDENRNIKWQGMILAQVQPFSVKTRSFVEWYHHTPSVISAISSAISWIMSLPGFSHIKRLVLRFSEWLKRTEMMKRSRVDINAGLIYESLAEVDTEKFITHFNMPDSFYSWFLINELHLWLLMGRFMCDPNITQEARLNLVEHMWEDAETKAKVLLLGYPPKKLKSYFELLHVQFEMALVSYDEAVQSDDKCLTSALWYRFFEMKVSDPVQLEVLVSYVRAQVEHLSKTPIDTVELNMVVKRQHIHFEPLQKHIDLVARSN